MTLANAVLSRGGSLRDQGTRYCSEDIRIRAVRRAEELVRVRSKVVAIDLPNSAEWAFWDIACLLAEVVSVPLPVFFNDRQRAYVLKNSGADTLVTSPGEGGGTVIGESLVRPLKVDQTATLPPGTAKTTYTSGTTGEPKGVCLGAEGMLATALAINTASARFAIDRHLSLLPYGVLLENIAGLYCGLMRGSCVVTRPVSADLTNALMVERPHSLILVPEMLQTLLAMPQAIHRHCLRFIAVGGAHTPLRLRRRARESGLPVFEGYGLSECGSVVALNTGEAADGSVGMPLEHVQDYRFGKDHELQIRSAAAFLGYVGKEARDPEEWIRTGDVAYCNADGSLTIDGRLGHRIVTSRGRNVSPEWVESVLLEQDAIRQCMVSGSDEQPQLDAVVVAQDGVTPSTLRCVVAAANLKLPEYARVGSLTISHEPWTSANGMLTSTGKLRRAEIRRRFAAPSDNSAGRDVDIANLATSHTTGERLNDAV